jgi:hypothetical protein
MNEYPRQGMLALSRHGGGRDGGPSSRVARERLRGPET